MAAVRGKNTKPELRVRSTLHRNGFRFLLHRNDLPGKPDLVLPKYRMAIFVNGCFWHGHDCKKGRRPATNKAFWQAKLDKNVERDRRNEEALSEAGWHVVVIWECELDEGIEQVTRRLVQQRDESSLGMAEVS